MHILFLLYFANLYMFRAYLGPSSRGTTACIQQLVLIFLFRLKTVVLVGFEPTRTTVSHLKRNISTNCCIHAVVPPDDVPRYARNMYRLAKYTKNKLCIKMVYLYLSTSRCTVNKHKKIRRFISSVGVYNGTTEPSALKGLVRGFISSPYLSL